MNTRSLTANESENLACVNRAGITSTLLFVTETGLTKGLLDATEPIRSLFLNSGVHDYRQQSQGEAHKRILATTIHTASGLENVTTSVYRPLTKKGDPRIWFYGFRKHAKAGDVFAVFVHEARIHLLNLTHSPLATDVAHGVSNPLTEFFLATMQATSAVAEELLQKLKTLAASGPLEAVCAGDTAIGRSIETALGISINSSKKPDYKGIELKSGRAAIAGRENRANLFACVPDWALSHCKSSKAILNQFGYQRDDKFKLYCTVSSRVKNSQGLIFHFDDAQRWLRENYVGQPEQEVAVWRLSKLEKRLAEKHPETFWIKALSLKKHDKEFFELLSIVHTKNPNLPQLERLLKDGTVTMDHLLKRTRTGGATDKGPLFKIVRPRIKELFLGEPRTYDLQ